MISDTSFEFSVLLGEIKTYMSCVSSSSKSVWTFPWASTSACKGELRRGSKFPANTQMALYVELIDSIIASLTQCSAFHLGARGGKGHVMEMPTVHHYIHIFIWWATVPTLWSQPGSTFLLPIVIVYISRKRISRCQQHYTWMYFDGNFLRGDMTF